MKFLLSFGVISQCYALRIFHSLALLNSLRNHTPDILWESRSQSYKPIWGWQGCGCARDGDGDRRLAAQAWACPVQPPSLLPVLSASWTARLGSCPMASPQLRVERLRREGASSSQSPSATPGRGLKAREGGRYPASTHGCSPGSTLEGFP